MSLKKSYFIPKGLTILILYITVFPYFLIGGIREDAEELIFSTYGEDIQVDFKKWNPPQEIKIYSEKSANSILDLMDQFEVLGHIHPGFPKGSEFSKRKKLLTDIRIPTPEPVLYILISQIHSLISLN
jgi:hypothetical protein